MWICFSSNPRYSNPAIHKRPNSVSRMSGRRFPLSMWERNERRKTKHGYNIRQHHFCRAVCLDQFKIRIISPEVKRVFTLYHFLKKRETFFNIHAWFPFLFLSTDSNGRGRINFPSGSVSVWCGRLQSAQRSWSSLSAIQSYLKGSSGSSFLPEDHLQCRRQLLLRLCR